MLGVIGGDGTIKRDQRAKTLCVYLPSLKENSNWPFKRNGEAQKPAGKMFCSSTPGGDTHRRDMSRHEHLESDETHALPRTHPDSERRNVVAGFLKPSCCGVIRRLWSMRTYVVWNPFPTDVA